MSKLANYRGKKFEKKVEKIFLFHKMNFDKHKRLMGFGKSWNVDFFLPTKNCVVECKNIQGNKNLQRQLMGDCLKFLDLRNRHLEMNFIIVFPKPSITMSSFVRFCISYKIKLATPETLISSFEKDVSETNKIFGRIISRNKEIVSLIKKSGFEGLTRKDISKIIGCHYNTRFFKDSNLKKCGIVKSVLSPKRYYTLENYQKSNEKQLFDDLKKNHKEFFDTYFAKKYGIKKQKIREVRKRFGLHKVGCSPYHFPCDECENSLDCYEVCDKFLRYSKKHPYSCRIKDSLKIIKNRHPSQQRF